MDEAASNNGFECEAASFLFVGTILRSMPERRWLDNLIADQIFINVPYALDRKETLEGRKLLIDWMGSYGAESFEAVYADCMNLFVGPGAPLAPPWESTFSKKGEDLVFQQETLDARKAYLSVGLRVSDAYREPDDHIGYELEFVSRLSTLIAEAREQGDFDEAERVMSVQADFLAKHACAWIFDWCELVCAHAATDFYRGIAMLVNGFLREACSVRQISYDACLPDGEPVL